MVLEEPADVTVSVAFRQADLKKLLEREVKPGDEFVVSGYLSEF